VLFWPFPEAVLVLVFSAWEVDSSDSLAVHFFSTLIGFFQGKVFINNSENIRSNTTEEQDESCNIYSELGYILLPWLPGKELMLMNLSVFICIGLISLYQI
jgi:hypothetical protein